MSPEERDRLALAMAPMTFGFTEFVATRLNQHALHARDVDVCAMISVSGSLSNQHALHARDVDVALHPTATLPPQAAQLVVDDLELVGRYTAKRTGEPTTIHRDHRRSRARFTMAITTDSVTFKHRCNDRITRCRAPAEPFIRLVYGRLDSEHTPDGNHADALNALRQVFPGP